MAKPSYSKILKKDLNGDGKNDLIYITEKNDKYYIESLIDDKIYPLTPKKSLNSLGYYNDIAPISIHFLDLSRNKLPDIILQSLDTIEPIQHIFTFKDNEFKDIFCSTNNILGVLDSKNNKSPKYISCNSLNINKTLNKHMLINSIPKNISYENYSLSFLNEILDFFDDTIFDKNINFDIIDSKIHQKSSKSLNSLIQDDFTYKLIDIFFMDIAWDTNSLPTEFYFKIRYSQTQNSNSKLLEFKLTVKLENSHIKITSIDQT
ncbi:MAG: hypothetical protein ACRC57_07640 [Sarcina sp.]